MFRILMTTRPQKRVVFRSFTKAAELVSFASANTADAGRSAPTYQTNIPNSGEDYQCDQSNEK